MDIVIKGEFSGGRIEAPPSKSYTHRAFIMGFLAEGKSEIRSPLKSSDTLKTLRGIKALGAGIEEKKGLVTIKGGRFLNPDEVIDCAGSGTTLRLLAGVSGLIEGIVVFSGNASLRKRPMGELLFVLERLGARVWSRNGRLPIATNGGLEGGDAVIDCEKSSQFLSSLLISLPLARKESHIKIRNLNSRPYADMTLEMLQKFGIEILRENGSYRIPARQSFKSRIFGIPGDFSSAAFFLVAGAITGKRVSVGNLDFSGRQGDKRIIPILEGMGAEVRVRQKDVSVCGGDLIGREIDCSQTPDLFPILCVLGAFCKGKTVLYNAPHLHFKESDRIKAMACQLARLGIKTEERHDGLVVYRGKIKKGVILDSHGDHRICMSLCIAALNSQDVRIKEVECISESYPSFFEDMKRLGGANESR